MSDKKMTGMTLYRVKWSKCPTHHNAPQLSFVEATNPEAARTIVKDYIERQRGIEWYVVQDPEPYTPPDPALGRIVHGQ